MLDAPRHIADLTPNDLEAHWMPYTANRAFKRSPRIVSRAEGMHYFTPEGRPIMDGTAALWCCNAGHRRRPIIEAIKAQADELDFAPSFNFGHPRSFTLASRIAALAPDDLDHVFFCNSGSEAVDTALKIALAYWNVKKQGQRTRLIGRERGYHGVGFGGIAVGGIVANRKFFGAMIPGVDHLPTTYNRQHQAFSDGEPDWGAHLADDLERIVALHDASTIAAVIVEPFAGATGVIAPPKGYLQRLRAICDKHDILLIFDEVISGFGRTGRPFAAETYGVTPDLLCFAKGVTSGTVPMGGVIARSKIYEAFMQGPEHVSELMHGYTYSAHPLACAAALATLDLYRDEQLFEKTEAVLPFWRETMRTLRDEPNVVDIRLAGLTCAVELAPHADGPGVRGFRGMDAAFREHGAMIRGIGDALVVTPPLIISRDEIVELRDKIAASIRSVA
jgi:beta-alanine--pyruvate transaminase